MTPQLAAIKRYPVKAIGRENLDRVTLTAGQILPWDRAFAVAHRAAKFEGRAPGWMHKRNFLRGVTGPQLMAVTCALDDVARVITFQHPDQDAITLRLDVAEDETAFVAWLTSIWPEDAEAPTALTHTDGIALTDKQELWVSINTQSSLAELGAALDQPDLSSDRFRGNLWIAGTEPWAEFDWIGKDIAIGGTVLHVDIPITRCKATMANPQTGRRDADTLETLQKGWGHLDFGVFARVTTGGEIAVGDPVEVRT